MHRPPSEPSCVPKNHGKITQKENKNRNEQQQLPVIGTALLQGLLKGWNGLWNHPQPLLAVSTQIPVFQRVRILLFQPCFEMKTSCNTTSAEKPLKSSPNFCSTHTKLLKTAFKTLFFFFQEMWHPTMSKNNLWQLAAGQDWSEC